MQAEAFPLRIATRPDEVVFEMLAFRADQLLMELGCKDVRAVGVLRMALWAGIITAGAFVWLGQIRRSTRHGGFKFFQLSWC